MRRYILGAGTFAVMATMGCANLAGIDGEYIVYGPSAGLAELFANDDLLRTYDFVCARYGHVLHNGVAVNASSHIDFDFYYADQLTVGIQGSELGAIMQLGSDDEIAIRLGVDPTVLSDGFDHLSLSGSGFNIPDADSILELTLEQWCSDECEHIMPLAGYVYVLRVVNDDGLDLIVKLLVTAVDPDERVAFQWERVRFMSDHDGCD